jgi:hypothetical protein
VREVAVQSEEDGEATDCGPVAGELAERLVLAGESEERGDVGVCEEVTVDVEESEPMYAADGGEEAGECVCEVAALAAAECDAEELVVAESCDEALELLEGAEDAVEPEESDLADGGQVEDE